MIKVSITTDKKRSFTIPVPYTLLRAGSSLLLSQKLWKFVIDVTNKYAEKPLPVMILDPHTTKQQLHDLLKIIKQHKGLELVDVTLQDGTKVHVRL